MRFKRLFTRTFKLAACAAAGVFALSVAAEDALPPAIPEFSGLAKAKWSLG